jgi:hypothetical protein
MTLGRVSESERRVPNCSTLIGGIAVVLARRPSNTGDCTEGPNTSKRLYEHAAADAINRKIHTATTCQGSDFGYHVGVTRNDDMIGAMHFGNLRFFGWSDRADHRRA